MDLLADDVVLLAKLDQLGELALERLRFLAQRHHLAVRERDGLAAVGVRHVDLGEEVGVLLEENRVLLQVAGDVVSLAQSRSLPRTRFPPARSCKRDSPRRPKRS